MRGTFAQSTLTRNQISPVISTLTRQNAAIRYFINSFRCCFVQMSKEEEEEGGGGGWWRKENVYVSNLITGVRTTVQSLYTVPDTFVSKLKNVAILV